MLMPRGLVTTAQGLEHTVLLMKTPDYQGQTSPGRKYASVGISQFGCERARIAAQRVQKKAIWDDQDYLKHF